MKRKVSDAQFKNQVIFTIKGMQANIRKINKMFPNTFKTYGFGRNDPIIYLNYLIAQIKSYNGLITRKPK